MYNTLVNVADILGVEPVKMLPQVRLELTTSACPLDLHPYVEWGGVTAYKYGALTDCATGAVNKDSMIPIFNHI